MADILEALKGKAPEEIISLDSLSIPYASSSVTAPQVTELSLDTVKAQMEGNHANLGVSDYLILEYTIILIKNYII